MSHGAMKTRGRVGSTDSTPDVSAHSTPATLLRRAGSLAMQTSSLLKRQAPGPSKCAPKSFAELEMMYEHSEASVVKPRRFDTTGWGGARSFLNRVMYDTSRFDITMGCVVFLNVCVMVVESDMGADCVMEQGQQGGCTVPYWVRCLNVAFIILYGLECLARIFVERCSFVADVWNVLDMIVVLMGIVQLGFEGMSTDLRSINMLRLFRIARLIRVLKFLRWVPMLWRLLSGLIAALQAMWWGLVLIVLLLVIWSIIAVEVIHPVAWKVHQGDDPQIQWCRETFSSVIRSTLYFFVTLVAGDGWATCAVPIIEDSPGTWIIFTGALVTVQLGFLNLVLAVIVDKAAEARELSKEEKIVEQRNAQSMSFRRWTNVMRNMDSSGDGKISLEELMAGFEIPCVKQGLHDIGIDKADLETMFSLMDADESGDLTYDEFIQSLLKAQTQDPRVYSMVMQLRLQKVESMLKSRLDAGFNEMQEFLRRSVVCPGSRYRSSDATSTKAADSTSGAAWTASATAPEAPVGGKTPQAPLVPADSVGALASELREFSRRLDRHLLAVDAHAAEAAAAQARAAADAAVVVATLRGGVEVSEFATRTSGWAVGPSSGLAAAATSGGVRWGGGSCGTLASVPEDDAEPEMDGAGDVCCLAAAPLGDASGRPISRWSSFDNDALLSV